MVHLCPHGYDVIMPPIVLGLFEMIYNSALECMHKLGTEKISSTK